MTAPVTRFVVLGPSEVWRGDEPVERLRDGDRPNPHRAPATREGIFARGVGDMSSPSATRTHPTHALDLCTRAGLPQEADVRARPVDQK